MRSLQILSSILAVILVLSPGHSPARDTGYPVVDDSRDIDRTIVIDGSGVHDIGELLLHTGNWGIFGSYPSTTLPVSQFPSAEWPAGSGVEHLFIAGLWVGAVKGCIISDDMPVGVSTAAFQKEFLPTDDPIDIIYESYEGAPGGNRLPSPFADDDGDGLIDEDPLDGRDNDGDGLIDEDFAAISQQMFSSWYTDYEPMVMEMYPAHLPLGLKVRQESYQWTDPRFDDFVGISFTITNTGDFPDGCLSRLYLGFFVDGDIGKRDIPEYWNDDSAGSWQGIRCTELGPARLSLGYMYDTDGDGGQATSYIGAMILGHPIDLEGVGAPERVGMTAFRVFTGGALPYENGGDPTNDFERYDAMSSDRIDRGRTDGDYRFLMSTGPFGLSAGQTMTFHVGIVAGGSLEELLDNAAMCQKLFDGLWYDGDGIATTGVWGRETPVEGPVQGIDPDPCDDDGSLLAAARGETIWINADCAVEEEFKEFCSYDYSDRLLFMTGVDGREAHVNWIPIQTEVLEADLDIRPGTCKNPFNIRVFDFLADENRKKGGVLPVAILGTEELDVTKIDISSVRLNGAEPLPGGVSYCDVSGPGEMDGGCHCAAEGPDGHTDLLLKFSNQDIAASRLILSIPQPGEKWILSITGRLDDGAVFQASDCVTFVGQPPKTDDVDRRLIGMGETRLIGASPNPFNPSTTIAFELASPGEVSIRIYDVAGRLIRVLVDERMPAGVHEAVWNGRDGSGSMAGSGVYFYRLLAGEIEQTRKMVLLK